jgi:Tfp pilus assembly protein PilX
MNYLKIIKKNSRYNELYTNENGVVAIFTALILIVVITIIVIAFAQIARNESSASFNNQLSTEAYYAAESGLNDVSAVVSYDASHPPLMPTGNSNCLSGIESGTTAVLAQNVSITCVSLNTSPPVLSSGGGAGSQQIFNIGSGNPGSPEISSINISYSSTNSTTPYAPSNCPPTSGEFPPSSGWGNNCPPVLEVDLVPTSNDSGTGYDYYTYDELVLEQNSTTFYLYPTNNSGTTAPYYTAVAQGSVTPVDCNNNAPNYTCQFSIGENSTFTAASLKIISFYNGSDLTISAGSSTSSSVVQNTQGNVAVDVTANADGTLKRTQVDISTGSSSSTSIAPPPEYAVQSNTSLCKRIVVGGNSYSNTTPFTFESIPGSGSVPGDIAAIPVTSGTPAAAGTSLAQQDPCDPFY